MPRIEVVRAARSRVTDLGRNGAHLGLSDNGAMDEMAARAANALVGNPATSPLVELTGSGLSFVVSGHQLVSVTGADVELSVAGYPRAVGAAHHVRPGELVELRAGRWGLRSYVAIHGSVRVPKQLGSCAPDRVLDLATALVDGQHLELTQTLRPKDIGFGAPVVLLTASCDVRAAVPTIDVTEGPDLWRFAGSLDELLGGEFIMNPASNEVGLRLTGPTPEVASHGEIQSSAVPVGAVELPGGDLVIVLHRGRGVTAGYPVPAVVTRAGLDRLAQLQPGERASFRATTVEESVTAYRRRLRAIELLRQRAAEVLAQQFAVVSMPEPLATA